MTAAHTDDLELLERLGGSRATVHRAVVRTTGRVVVTKHAPWDRPDAAAGLGREAAVLTRVQHPGLVRLLHTIEDDHGRMLVLAHAPGGSLADRLERHGPLPPAEVADLGARLAEVLAVLHREGVVHRDVHPANVVVDAELQPVLTDLDHALDASGEHLPADDEVVGHPDHVDPRLFRGRPAGPATDLHALATTLWTLATGAPPPRPGPRAPVDLPVDGCVPPTLHDALVACLTGSDAATVATGLRAAALDLAAAPSGPVEDLPPPPPRVTTPPPTAPTAPAGVGVLTGGGPGQGGETRRWGAAPRRASLAGVPQARNHRWLVAAMALAVVALAPAALWLGRGEPAVTPAAATVAVVPPPPCPEVTATPDDVLADLDGDGCSEAMRLDDGVLVTPAGSYRLGQPGDVLVAGDWNGDGAWTPGLYRPSTGEAFLFDAAPGRSTVTSRPPLRLAPGATPQVVDADGDGHHELVTAPADA